MPAIAAGPVPVHAAPLALCDASAWQGPSSSEIIDHTGACDIDSASKIVMRPAPLQGAVSVLTEKTVSSYLRRVVSDEGTLEGESYEKLKKKLDFENCRYGSAIGASQSRSRSNHGGHPLLKTERFPEPN